MEKETTFSPSTTPSTERFYLVRVIPLEENTMIEEKDVIYALSGSFKKLFGTSGRDRLLPTIHDVGECHYVISIKKEDATSLRVSLSLPVSSGKILGFEVISSSSFLQPLLHDSRLFFKPLL